MKKHGIISPPWKIKAIQMIRPHGFFELRRPASVVGLRLPKLGFSVAFSARKSEAKALNSRSLEAEA